MKHTQARLCHPVNRRGVGTVSLCRGAEGGNDGSGLFDQQPYFLIPHHSLFLGKNVPSLHQMNREIDIAFGVTYFPTSYAQL